MSPRARLAVATLPAAAVTLLLMAFMNLLIAERPGVGPDGPGVPAIRFGSIEKPEAPPPTTELTPPEVKPLPPGPKDIGVGPGTKTPTGIDPFDPPVPPTFGPLDFIVGARGFPPAGPNIGLEGKSLVPPVYPPKALMDGIQGWVEVEFTVLADGSTADVRVVEAEPRRVFDASAIAAAQRWRFHPLQLAEGTAGVRTRQRIDFVIPD